jgi:hypothetical protein
MMRVDESLLTAGIERTIGSAIKKHREAQPGMKSKVWSADKEVGNPKEDNKMSVKR